MKSWTRTLNIDDAHTLLALAEPGTHLDDWTSACHEALPHVSMPRRRELIRILRDGFLEWEQELLHEGKFLQFYATAPAAAQLDLVDLQWALSHPISLIAVEQLVAPALEHDDRSISWQAVEELVQQQLHTSSAESIRKTRTTLLGALEGIGTLTTRGTGQHRAPWAARAQPHPLAFGYLVHRDLAQRRMNAMIASEVSESSLGARITQCGRAHARKCVDACLATGVLVARDDEIGAPSGDAL